FDIKADVLVSLALIASIGIHEDFAAGEVAFIMQLGALLEDLTVAKARAGIEKLVKLTPQTARVIGNGTETIIPAEQVKVGELIRVLPGETIPVDGVIVSGQTSINQAVMTGESLPVDKAKGDEVSSGTVNQFGAFEMKATKVGEDSSIQKMIRLVQSADAGKAKIVGLADRWATWIVVTALTAAILTWLITRQPIRAVTILVVFCPCSLVLATPTAIMAAIGNATKHGFLVKEGDALERLAKVKRVTFDKTGTLTVGVPKVVAAESVVDKYSDEQIYTMLAGVEKNSEHPLGKAIVNCFRNDIGNEIPKTTDFAMVPGQGVKAVIDGKMVCAGNERMIRSENMVLSDKIREKADAQIKKGASIIYVSVDHVLSGLVALSDSLRWESAGMIREMKAIGVTPVLITGDNEKAAGEIASEVGIVDVNANCLPEDKLKIIDGYQKKKELVCMIGDGVNDAPALKIASVGIAMGGVGSDIAVDAADIALVDDEIRELPHLFSLSKKMMTKITFNLSFSMLLNFVAIVLAMTGILNPVIGALVHNAGSVFVIINSAFLLKWRKTK
ncbi:MAG: cation-translocating P-type ATPase, partial [Lachnospiraceae bacterium]|nr:cation-translocating P-type ATPase [Lachnospiraceae bacterium]